MIPQVSLQASKLTNLFNITHLPPLSFLRTIPLAALQHYTYCPRQCALIHTEQVWLENGLTTLGKIEHERADSKEVTRRGNLVIARSIPLVCPELGIRGKADAIDYEYKTSAPDAPLVRITPIEYKHGRPKEHNADAMQLCAQALCLEHMHGLRVEEGHLFYQQTKHRICVSINHELRQQTRDCIAAARALLEGGRLPASVRQTEKCRSCSLEPLCLPRSKKQSAAQYLSAALKSALSPTNTSSAA